MSEENGTPDGARGSPIDAARVSLLWATEAHATEIARLHASMFEAAWDAAAVTRLLAHPGSIALVASFGQPPVPGGFVLAQIAADEAEILTLGVVESWRGQGVGGRLLEGAKRAAARAGAEKLHLEVGESNAPALALYRRAGFVEVGRRKGYYARTGSAPEDALVLSCLIGTSGNARG